jgi:hypothetical protein
VSKVRNMTLVEVLSAARQLSVAEKIKLIRVLVEDLGCLPNLLAGKYRSCTHWKNFTDFLEVARSSTL